jgi:hypothetical protein
MTYENWKLEQAEPILFEVRTNYIKRDVEKPTWMLKAEEQVKINERLEKILENERT